MATSTLRTSSSAQRNLTRYPTLNEPPSSSCYLYRYHTPPTMHQTVNPISSTFNKPTPLLTPHPPVPLRTMHLLPVCARQKHLSPAPTPH